jgi:fluoride exporter
MRFLYIGLFGLCGVFARYYVGLLASHYFPSSFPLGTFLINIVGAFLIGVVYVLGIEHAVVSPDLRVGVMVGFLGGFTTFSSYCLEAARLFEEAAAWRGGAYIALSPFLGLTATFAGLFLTRLCLRFIR